MSSVFPAIERLADGGRRYSWTTRLEQRPSGPLEGLATQVEEMTLTRYRQALRQGDLGQHADADLQLQVTIEEGPGGLYTLDVRASGDAPNWDAASLFGVMQALDALAGPVLEIQGRKRAECPPWFVRTDEAPPAGGRR
jgi:hypothetical protein